MMRRWVLFDWGDTLMRTLDYPGPMCTWPRIETVEGALEVLHALRDRAGVALASNAGASREQDIREALALGGLDTLVERIFCFKSVGHKKSSPQFFAHVMDQLGQSAEGFVMVGDDFEQDVASASAMGIKAVWFNERTAESRNSADVRTIHHLAELPAALEAWGFLR